jgi:hypothetical protein
LYYVRFLQIAFRTKQEHYTPVTSPSTKQAAAPAATGNAGPQFETKVGAFYLLSLLAAGEPRGLPGATVRTVGFQQRSSGRPLDDVVVQATNADGSDAILEIQAKRSLTFTASDNEFKDVVAQMWEAAQNPEFETTRYELAAAIARTTTRVEQACQETLHWARQLPNATAFANHITRKKFASDGMRDFVAVFRANLAAINAPTDDEIVWRLLRRFQILPFDFESPGSDYEHRARERARFALAPDQSNRAAELWPVLLDYVGACARAGGSCDRPSSMQTLQTEHGFKFEPRADLRSVDSRLAEAARAALAEIKDDVGGVKLARIGLIDQAQAALEQHRLLHIVGMGGVGKSWVLKALAERLTPEGRIIVLRNGRIVPGGWMRMAHAIGCVVSRDELFNELGCGGGATLFIDNIDQIAESAEWATVTDLLSGVAKNPGWRAVVTGTIGNEEWKATLGPTVQSAGIASLTVDPISDDESEVLSEQNQALAIILSGEHPAHSIARNLFYLSRMIELGAGKPETAGGIASETDLARLWWRYGGGRAEDDDRFARLKVMRAMGAQLVSLPSRVAFKIDDFDSSAVARLLRFDSLREDTKGSTVAFRHDVLRDWTVGFLIHQDDEVLADLPMKKPLPPSLARGLEVAARLALDADATGERWSALLATVERDGLHGSWTRPVLLALPRAEKALALFVKLEPILLADDGRRLGDIIRLMIAVDSEPLAKLAARLQPSIPIPTGVGDLIVPKGLGWAWLVAWLVMLGEALPTARIPDVAKVFQAWLISTQQQTYPFNALMVDRLFDWLARIEDNMSYRVIARIEDAPPCLNIPHMRDVRDEIRMTAFLFAHLSPTAAEKYLSALDPDEVRHYEMQAILQAPGTLVRAAPTAMATFTLGALIEKEDPDDVYHGNHRRFGPFGVHDHLLSPASPSQGPFLELLEHAPAEGLRVVRELVEHATQWRREMYARDSRPFPRISVPFPTGTRSFEGDWSVYYWSRSIAPSVITASALMSLEAWGHRQIEAGRPFEDVLHDVLGPDGSSIALVAVAVDLVLSHWQHARDVAWPLVATPEILEFDDARSTHDISGVDRLLDLEPEPSAWSVKRADLDSRPSRQTRLSHTIAHYALQADPNQLSALRASLEQARNEIKQKPNEGEDPVSGLRATADRAVRMTYAEHWPLIKITLPDGSEIEVNQYQPEPEEAERIATGAARAAANIRHMNVRYKVQAALFDPSKSTAEIVAEGLAWAKEQPQGSETGSPDDKDRDDFNTKWDRRAVVMTAALLARDYGGEDRSAIIDWALPILEAATKAENEFRGNDQIEYSMVAIAALGLIALYSRGRDIVMRDALLGLASNQHLAVVKSVGNYLPELAKINPCLPRALVRIIMTSSIHPRRSEGERQTRAGQRAYRRAVEKAIAAERRWLDGADSEPPWPDLPSWLSRPRRAIRLGGPIEEEEEDEDEIAENPDEYVDEHVLGALAGYLVRMTIGDLPPWIVDWAAHLMRWTDQANGPHDDKGRDRDNRPHTWNGHFFEFAGILSVAVPHADLVKIFLHPMTQFKDEPFHDAMATYLRGFDRAVRATDTKKPENPDGVRAILASRIQKGRNYRRYLREKTFMSETHTGDAMTAMFFQPHRMMGSSRPSIPDNWIGLDGAMPVLTSLVVGARSSGYVAVLFLNLVETSPRAALLPFVVQAMSAWCSTYGTDTNFWSEKEVGSRVCAWLDRTLTTDPGSTAVVPSIVDELTRCLDVLIRSGVAQAREIEDRIGGTSRRSA